MIFLKTDADDYEEYSTCMQEVEINTLAELRAFALAGQGKIEINFIAHNRDGCELNKPTIRLIVEEK